MLTRIVTLHSYLTLLLTAVIPATGAQTRTASRAPDLEQRLASITQSCGGRVGVAAVHVESAQTASLAGDQALPLYSVVKLPLAVVVLKEVERGILDLDQRVTVRREDVAPGAPGNTERWAKVPMSVTVRDLLEFSLVDSDNTSADKLFDLIGGPQVLERRMHALGFRSFKVETSMKELGRPDRANTGTPEGVGQLLVALQQGTVLKARERTVLFDMMARARTGLKRIVAGVPSGTPVLHKTGTGNNAVNDVGLISLPGNQGHIAIAVMISGSKLAPRDQENLVAEVARVVYEAWDQNPEHVRSPK